LAEQELVEVVCPFRIAKLGDHEEERRIDLPQRGHVQNGCPHELPRLRAEPALLADVLDERRLVEMQHRAHTRSPCRQGRRLRSLMSSVKPTLTQSPI